MNIEEKAKAYDKAAQFVKDLFEKGEKQGLTILDYRKEFETVFPEIVKDRDEIIREMLVEIVKHHLPPTYSETILLNWLEKQKKTNELSAKDSAIINTIATFLEDTYRQDLAKKLINIAFPKRWKPTEDQMRVLSDARMGAELDQIDREVLDKLYVQLKTL